MTAPRRALVAVAAIVAIAAVVLATRGDDRLELRAVFANASGLRVNSDVRIAGVPAGSVKAIDVSANDEAVATIAVERRAGAVTDTARATILPANLLGEKYVELKPGDGDAALADGATIPLERTATPVELDDLLNVLDTPTRAMLDALITETGLGFGGRGLDLQRLLAVLPSSLAESRELVASLASETQAIASMVRSTDRLLAAVGPKDAELRRFVDGMAGALDAVAARRTELGAAVREAPAGLAQLRATLLRAQEAAARLRPAARELTTAAGPLTEVLKALPGFTDAAVPTLERARSAGGAIENLADRALPLARELRPFGGRLARTGRRLDPVVGFLDDGGGIELFLRVLEGWAQAIQARDGLGHLFRNQLVLSEEIVEALLSRYLAPGALNPQARKREGRAGSAGPAAPRVAAPVPGADGPRAPQAAQDSPGGGDAGNEAGHGPVASKPGKPLGELLDFLLGP